MAWGAGARLEGLTHAEALALACVEIEFRAPHATLSPWPRRLDGVEAH